MTWLVFIYVFITPENPRSGNFFLVSKGQFSLSSSVKIIPDSCSIVSPKRSIKSKVSLSYNRQLLQGHKVLFYDPSKNSCKIQVSSMALSTIRPNQFSNITRKYSIRLMVGKEVIDVAQCTVWSYSICVKTLFEYRGFIIYFTNKYIPRRPK